MALKTTLTTAGLALLLDWPPLRIVSAQAARPDTTAPATTAATQPDGAATAAFPDDGVLLVVTRQAFNRSVLAAWPDATSVSMSNA